MLRGNLHDLPGISCTSPSAVIASSSRSSSVATAALGWPEPEPLDPPASAFLQRTIRLPLNLVRKGRYGWMSLWVGKKCC